MYSQRTMASHVVSCDSHVIVPRAESDIVVNDVVCVIGGDCDGGVIVISDDNEGAIIINPDYLISPTAIATGITCTRR